MKKFIVALLVLSYTGLALSGIPSFRSMPHTPKSKSIDKQATTSPFSNKANTNR